MRKIYLAGAIEWQDDEYTTAWRRTAKTAAKAISGGRLEVIDPTFFDGAAQNLEPSEVVIRDTYLLHQADAILADGRKPGWGTAMEIKEAYAAGKLVVVWGCTRRSLFLRHHTAKFVDTVPEGIEYIYSMLDLMEE